MNDADAVLAANLEFYSAFPTRDVDAMEALWARKSPVACLDPGWPPLVERDEIVESWRGILSNPTRRASSCYDERVFLYGDTAFVICEEEIQGATLIATNYFTREAGIWRICAPPGRPADGRRQPARAGAVAAELAKGYDAAVHPARKFREFCDRVHVACRAVSWRPESAAWSGPCRSVVHVDLTAS